MHQTILLSLLLLISFFTSSVFAGREEALQKLEEEASYPFFTGDPGKPFSDLESLTDYACKIKSCFQSQLEDRSLENIIIIDDVPSRLLPALHLLYSEYEYEFDYYGLSFGDTTGIWNLAGQLTHHTEHIETYSDIKISLQKSRTKNAPIIIGIERCETINKDNRTHIQNTLDCLSLILKDYNPKLIVWGATLVNDLGYGLGNKISRALLKENKQLYPIVLKDKPSLYVADKIESSSSIEMYIYPLKDLSSQQHIAHENEILKMWFKKDSNDWLGGY